MNQVVSSTNEKKLHEVINGIDSMCQTQLERIKTIVTATLRAMETAEFWRQPDNFIELLGLIEYTADDLMNFVNASAETVGSHYMDDIGRARAHRVSEAFEKACQEKVDFLAFVKHRRAVEAQHV